LPGPDTEGASVGVDDTAFTSAPRSMWARGEAPLGPSHAWYPFLLDGPIGSPQSAFDVEASVRVDSLPTTALTENPQMVMLELVTGADHELGVLYSMDGRRVVLLERNACGVDTPLRDTGSINQTLASPFVPMAWRRLRIEVRAMPTATNTHVASLWVDQQKVVDAWPICLPSAGQRILRVGLKVTGSVKPTIGWSARYDDVVLFAR
jgi:hypothetical protein